MIFEINDFIQLWKILQDDSFINLRNLFRRYLVEKPYDPFVGQRLIYQLNQVGSKIESAELKAFIKALCDDIKYPKSGEHKGEKSGEKLKEFIQGHVEDPDTTQPEVAFLDILENNCRPVKKPSSPDHRFFASYKRVCFHEVTTSDVFNSPSKDTEAEDVYIEECEKIGLHFLKLGILDQKLGNDTSAETNYKLAEKYYANSKSHDAIVLRNNLCDVLLNLGKLDEALYYYKKNEAQSQLTKNQKSHIKDNNHRLREKYNELGYKNICDKNYELSIRYFKIALELYGDSQRYNAIVCRLNIYNALINLGKFDEAFIFYKQLANLIFKQIPDEKNQQDLTKISKKFTSYTTCFAQKCVQLAHLNFANKKYVLAEQYFKKLHTIYRDTNIGNIFSVKTNLCSVLLPQGKYDEAFIYLKEMIVKLDELSPEDKKQGNWNELEDITNVNKEILAGAYEALATQHQASGKYTLAEENRKKARECVSEAEVHRSISPMKFG